MAIVLLLRYPARRLGCSGGTGADRRILLILAGLGKELGLLSESATNAIIAAATVSIRRKPGPISDGQDV